MNSVNFYISIPEEIAGDVSQALNVLIEHLEKENRIVVRNEEYHNKLNALILWCKKAQLEITWEGERKAWVKEMERRMKIVEEIENNSQPGSPSAITQASWNLSIGPSI